MPDTPQRDTVYFYKFNNYYNRIIKRYDTIADYGDPMLTQTECNFVHGDGVNSSFTINKGTLLDTPDYCVVLDYNNKISRWFVINSFKSRSGQDVLTLRRDLIADFYADVINYSPCLIRKGYVPNTNPLVFQDEGVQYNKIKKDEILIKDNSNCSYIVGFIANNTSAVAQLDGTVTPSNYDYHYDTIDDFPLKNYVEGVGLNHTESATHLLGNLAVSLKYTVRVAATPNTASAELTINLYGAGHPVGYTNTFASYNKINNDLYWTDGGAYGIQFYPQNTSITAKAPLLEIYANRLINKAYNIGDITIMNPAKQQLGLEESNYESLAGWNGKRVEINNVIYDVTLVSENNQVKKVKASATVRTNINRLICPSATTINGYGLSYYGNNNSFAEDDVYVLGRTQDFYLLFTQAQSTVKTEIKASNLRTHLEDAPYDMFMMINESGIEYDVNGVSYTSDHNVNLNMAQAICEQSGSASFDVQIVPFNPLKGTILADGSLDFTNYDVVEIKNSSNVVVGHYVMCPKSTDKLVLNKDELKFNPTDYKKSHNLDLYRLCSPNQESIFDFDPSMNGGINTWEISFNYKPFASYIKIQPTWGWLYAEYPTFNGLTDFRGLVYNSSLCISQLNDEYSNYISNNKNFQQLFDNQINTLTKTQDIQINALEETLGLRAYSGMPISSILRTVGGAKDIEMQRELNNVALTKMRTDFNYQMDNIKSMPHTIKKLTSINADTRIFPYIEYYTCSETEETAFNNKILYTGMTIMATGKIADYCKPNEETFIQASLIRLILLESEESADNHIAVEIASELDKGIYITKEE